MSEDCQEVAVSRIRCRKNEMSGRPERRSQHQPRGIVWRNDGKKCKVAGDGGGNMEHNEIEDVLKNRLHKQPKNDGRSHRLAK